MKIDTEAYAKMARAIAAQQPLPDPPEGLENWTLRDPFEAFLGPYYIERGFGERGAVGEGISMAFRVDERHLNGRGQAHGGSLLSFADAVLGGIAFHAVDGGPCVTLSMQANFLKAVQLGQLVFCRGRVVRKTRSIVFVAGEFDIDGETVLTVSSLWKVVRA